MAALASGLACGKSGNNSTPDGGSAGAAAAGASGTAGAGAGGTSGAGGAAGTSSAAGTSGTAGAAGAAGTSGTLGVGGAAGTGAAAGTGGGAAGAGGAAGRGGAGGTGGSGGAGATGGAGASGGAGGTGGAGASGGAGEVWSGNPRTTYVKASNTEADDGFGVSVALTQDLLAVGAGWEDSRATGINGDQRADSGPSQIGAVYVFSQKNGQWAQEAYIKPSIAPISSDLFGQALALDGNTLAVGYDESYGEMIGIAGIHGGAVYVFTRDNGAWSEQGHLHAEVPGAFDGFGAVLSLSGDRLAIGAPLESSAATGVNGDQTDDSLVYAGAAYVFARTGGVWSQEAYIKASNPSKGASFGDSVALDGDTLAVGSPQEDSGALNSGAVYVFARDANGWAQTAHIKASNPDPGDFFGVSVALSGDVLAVGAPFEASDANGINGDQTNNAAANAGAVYIFVRSGGTWSQQAYLKAARSDAADRFGVNVALSGSLLAVTATGESSNATGIGGDQTNNMLGESGAVYLFRQNGTVWTQVAYVKATNTAQLDHFGGSVALYGTTLAVGARDEDSNAKGIGGDQLNNDAFGSGAAYLFQ